MPAYPQLDANTLARLRKLTSDLHASAASSLPLQEIVDLAKAVEIDAGLTVDFEATQSLGQAMIVVRAAAEEQRSSCLHVLSKRECEVASLIAQGRTNKEIARRLFLALSTVKDHVHRILRKTGLANRAAIAASVKSPTT